MTNSITNEWSVLREKNGFSILEFVFLIGACFFYTNFEIQSSMYIYASIAFCGYLLFISIAEPLTRKYAIGLIFIATLFSILYLTLTDTSSIGDVANRTLKRFVSKFSQLQFIFFPIALLYRTIKKASNVQLYIIYGLVLINSLLLASTAIQVASVNPEILHTFDQASIEEAGLSFTAFYYVYAFTFIIISSVVCYKWSTYSSIKKISVALGLFSSYFLIKAQFALSIITTFVSLVYLYNLTAVDKSNRTKNIVITLLLVLLLPSIIQFIVSVSSSRILNDRLLEVYDAITGEDTTNKSDGQGRLELYWMCIKAFLQSPIWGNRVLPDDGHASFFTIPADIGVLGIYIIYITFKNAYKIVSGILGCLSIYFKPLMLQIILMGFTNPIHSSPSIYIYLFFLCPLSYILFINNDVLKNN